jgi:hypothetical protein
MIAGAECRKKESGDGGEHDQVARNDNERNGVEVMELFQTLPD